MSVNSPKLYYWELSRDRNGHRDYTAQFRIRTDDINNGPALLLSTFGLPVIGSTWAYGNDVDPWAFCLPETEVRPFKTKGEPGKDWLLTYRYSTRPQERCQDTAIENPLLEPPRLSGSFVKYIREATKDKDGNPILTSSLERVKGPIVEKDFNRPTVRVEMNVLNHPLAIYTPMVDTLNDAELWGLPARSIKLSNVIWTRKLYGVCTFYYTLAYEFEVGENTSWDTEFLDEGTRVLAEGGDATDPRDFVQYKDPHEENTTVLLDGNGAALDDSASPVYKELKLYGQSNFLLLGIPTTL